ncbi:MAG: hypothetical protein II393_00015 [Cytophagales bacterium]|nr:hypothetical protein [Cytophagales bacterium]
MIIVSQNKRNIYNFDNVKSIDIVNNGIYISDDILSDMGTCIANYETEERAKGVLQEIIKVYKFYNGKTYYVEDRNNLLGDYENGVYEMPIEKVDDK